MNPPDISNLFVPWFCHVIFPAAFFLKCYYCLQKCKTILSFTFFSHCAKHTKRIKRLKIFYSIPNSLCLQGAKPVFQNSPWIEHHMKCRWQHCSACIHPHQPTSLLDHSIQWCEIDSTEEFSSFLELHITNGNNTKAWAEMEVEDRSQMSLGLRVNLA